MLNYIYTYYTDLSDMCDGVNAKRLAFTDRYIKALEQLLQDIYSVISASKSPVFVMTVISLLNFASNYYNSFSGMTLCSDETSAYMINRSCH